MTRRMLLLRLAIPLAFPLVGVACTGGGTRSARAGIVANDKTFEAAFFRGDAAAIAQTYTEDAEWYVPDEPVIKGREAIARAWKEQIGAGGNRLRIDVGEVEQQGDRAYEIGRFAISGPDGGVLAAGKYIVIWARQRDGEWKTSRDIFNWDIPPRRPASVAAKMQ